MIDNITALSDINHMGTSKFRNALSKAMWLWCRTRHIWLTAVHIPGVEITSYPGYFILCSVPRPPAEKIPWYCLVMHVSPRIWEVTINFS